MYAMSGYDGLNDIIPPDVSGFGQLTRYLPSKDEVMQAAIAGGGVAAGLIGGLGLERLLKRNVEMIPNWAYPIIHGLVGMTTGKLIADYNAPLGVGVASGVLALALLRGLQTYLGLDISFAGLGELSDDLSDLSDLLGEDTTDLLPSGMDGLGQILVEDTPSDGLSQIQVTEENPFAGWGSI